MEKDTDKPQSVHTLRLQPKPEDNSQYVHSFVFPNTPAGITKRNQWQCAYRSRQYVSGSLPIHIVGRQDKGRH